MIKADPDYVIVGKIGSTYGIKGWLKIFSYTAIKADILEYHPWYLENDSSWKAIEIDEGRQHGKTVVAKFAGYNTPEHARLLTGKTIAIKRDALPKLAKHEYYWSDLEGLTVINQRNESLGTVVQLLETGANDVLVVKQDGQKEHAIPYLPGKVITEVDLVKGVIYVDWEII
jgi:16S rRNA processing protein RimM